MTVRLEPSGTGEIEKSIFIASNDPARPLTSVKVHADVQQDVHEAAGLNVQMSVFSAQCQSCHTAAAAGKTGQELYDAVCAVCHGSLGGNDRRKSLNAASWAQDLKELRKVIASGPDLHLTHGFSAADGGPLSERQIDSLVDLFKKWQTTVKKKHGGR
jgi:mono/diheme cytochrome c family protein